MKYIVDNSDEIVEDVDSENNVVVMSIENGNMAISGVSVMISAGHEDLVL